MPPLYDHQSRFLARNPNKAIISHEAGTGKTRIACEWMKVRADKKAIVVCTKATKQKWIDDLVKWEVEHDVLVVTKEEFKSWGYNEKRDVIVIDECHHFSSPLFVARARSQLSEKLYNYIQTQANCHILLMSANVIRSTPWNLHTLAVYAGQYIDWRKYQDRFFELVRRPYLPRPAWQPRKGWQKEMQKLIPRYCDVAIMSDCTDVPIHQYELVGISLKDDTKQKMRSIEQEEWEAMKVWTEQHRLENGKEKLEYIKELGERNKKIVVVCHYREQLDIYEKELAKQKQVFVLHGGVKDQSTPIREAQEAEECYLLVQASMGAGFDLDRFSIMVFASMSFKYVDHSQMLGRINSIHNLHRNRYIYLIGGDKDKAIYDTIKRNEDFDPTKYLTKKAKQERGKDNRSSDGLVQEKLL